MPEHGGNPQANAELLHKYIQKGEIIMLEKGVKAPDFTLLNQEGEPVSLSGFLG